MKYLKNNKLMVIVIIYIFVSIVLMINNQSFFYSVINPLFWGILIIYLIFEIKNNNIKFVTDRKYLIYIIIISSISVLVYFYLGFIIGFTKSPYNHEIGTILKNIIVQIVPIIGIEITRCIIATKNRDNKLILFITTILLFLTEINYNTIISLSTNKQEFFEYICGTIFPLIAINFLCTYLTLKGSYSLPLVLRIFSKLTILLLPILTKTNWFINGTVGVLFPTLIYILFEYIFINKTRGKTKNFLNGTFYIITIILCTGLVCFMLGLFKYEPITILSNSMSPVFNKADVIIYKKLNEEELKQIPNNSIVVYTSENQNIAHRVVDVIKENDTIKYQTKGDNNNMPDTDLVETNQIKGIYSFTIKYIGFPSVWLYEYFNS